MGGRGVGGQGALWKSGKAIRQQAVRQLVLRAHWLVLRQGVHMPLLVQQVLRQWAWVYRQLAKVLRYQRMVLQHRRRMFRHVPQMPRHVPKVLPHVSQMPRHWPLVPQHFRKMQWHVPELQWTFCSCRRREECRLPAPAVGLRHFDENAATCSPAAYDSLVRKAF